MRVHSLELPEGSAVVREPTRPPAFREPTFAERFDARTLVYDAILEAEPERIRAIGPPLLNLREAMKRAKFTIPGTGGALPFEVRTLKMQTQLMIKVPPGTRAVDVECDFGRFRLECGLQNNDLFKGERTLFTLSKNNRLEWIQDWIRFYRDVHGATAVLIFDNASTSYSTAALMQAISAVSGLRTAVVVEWPFKHGPTGIGQQARSVLNCDIDELVVSKHGGSVFDQVERRSSGVTSFYGDWVFGIDDVTRQPEEGHPVLFRDFEYVLTPHRAFKYGVVPYFPMRCRQKWAAVPRRCPPGAQWSVHSILGWWKSRLVSPRFRFRHFREINFNWKYERLGRLPLEGGGQHEDPLMRSAFARVDWTR